ncbi:MAG: 16S rRNA (uracil(1498)-N(3))-methyltransferase [Burkholderiales bacterium]|nr:16S rRNA (uracil(1498)-N(3))-methyltransferase [Burkholderiales bacterium]
MNGKSLTRIYFPGEILAHGECVLAPDQAHHVARVLRLAVGEAVVLFDGRGSEHSAVIKHIAKARVTLQVGESRAVDRESPLAVTLAQGISSGDRMDFTIQKAVELGVVAIRPLASHRSVVRLDAARALKRAAHWQAVAIAACEQCGRNTVPQVLPVMDFTGWLAHEARQAAALRVLLSPEAQVTLGGLSRPSGKVTLLAGPEGGLSPQEQQDARSTGFTAVKLGPRTLRTETAALAALSAMQMLWGDFK